MTFKTLIKYTSGDEVYWLSSEGFTKGIVKSVKLIDSVDTPRTIEGKQKEVSYYLWHKGNASMYQGDKVPEDKIFNTYGEMVRYYSESGKLIH